MKLSEYVLKRNGVPLGANESLKNMLSRSLGAGRFSIFWKYWNPIWGYYLGSYIFKPLKKLFPAPLALLLTFGFSGLLHDAVIMLIRWDIALVFTPWFLLMAVWLLLSDFASVNYTKYPWLIRVVINVAIIGSCFLLSYQISV